MRFAVLSDIHGNLPALEAVIGDLAEHGFERLILAGDYIGGPHPVESINLLLTYDPIMISGNSDSNLLRLRNGKAPLEWYESLQFSLLRWANQNIDDRTLEILQSLPEQLSISLSGSDAIRVVHGSPRNQAESIFPESDPETLEIAFSNIKEQVLICGHTHVPWLKEQNGRLALNPGAVCGPLNGQACAQYAILDRGKECWHVEHRSVSYDIALIRKAFIESGLLHEGGALARAFLRSIETGTDVALNLLKHAYNLADDAGYKYVSAVPDDIWEQADKTFDWESTIDPCTP